MEFRKITIKQSVAESIAEVSWFLESEGLLAAAEEFAHSAYDFIQRLGIVNEGIEPIERPKEF